MQMRHLRIMHLFWEHYFLSRCLRYHPLIFLISSYKCFVRLSQDRASFFFFFFIKLLIYCHVPLLLMLDFQTISREMLLCLYISFFLSFFLSHKICLLVVFMNGTSNEYIYIFQLCNIYIYVTFDIWKYIYIYFKNEILHVHSVLHWSAFSLNE